MLVLVANKSDLQDERAVPKDYGLSKLKDYGADKCFETSAFDD